MTDAHTPGEWTKPGLSRLERVRAYRGEFGGDIANAVAAVDAEIYRQERDGRLRLAAAAPDLLEAAQLLLMGVSVERIAALQEAVRKATTSTEQGEKG